MASFKEKFFTSFISLNLTQFFSALNDNLYKLLLVFLLIHIEGEEHSYTILSVAGIVFVVPFILLASVVGSLADRFSKRTIIYFTRILEILTMTLGLLAFLIQSAVGGYLVLFLMAIQSAIFSPCKYGIIPEIVKKERISHYNGILTATTYLAIILGTFLASFLTEATHRNYALAVSFCIGVAVLGGISCLGIKKTKPQDPEKKISFRFASDLMDILKRSRRTRYLFYVIVFGAFFLFMGAYIQLNIIPFALQSLHVSEVFGGYLFLMVALGIGLGAFLAGRLSGKEIELGFTPLATIGVTVCYFLLYVCASYFYIVVPVLFTIGIFGGFYIIPVDAYIQSASPNIDRGQNVAVYNFLSFIGVILASLLLALLGNVLGLTAAEGFAIMGCLTFAVGILLILILADQVLRLCVASISRLFWDLSIVGRRRIRPSPPALFICQRTAWVDTVIVMAALPRMIRYIVPISPQWVSRSYLYKIVRLIPVDMEHFTPIGNPALTEIHKELKAGHSVCLMHPVAIATSTLKEWQEKLKGVLQDIQVPVIPIHISRVESPEKKWLAQLKLLFLSPIKVVCGTKIKF